MPFWTRQLPDGKQAPGFGVYFVALSAVSALVWYSIRSNPGGLSLPGPPKAAANSKVPGIGGAVEGVSKVEKSEEADQAAQLGSSTRIKEEKEAKEKLDASAEPEATPSSSIFAALARLRDEETKPAPEGRPALNEGGPSPSGYMPPGAPTVPKVPIRLEGEQQRQAGGMIAYRRPAAPPNSAPASNPSAANRTLSGFNTGEFLPRGYEIEAYLLSRVETGNQETVVTLGVARNIVHNGKLLLPMGTRLLGSSAGAAVRDRVPIRVDTVLYPNGDEMPISAVVRDADKMTGVRSYYIPPPTWVQMAPFVNDFLSAYLAILAQNQNRGISLQLGEVRVQPQVPTFDAKTEALNATSKAIQTFAERQMTELSRRYAATNVVPPGTRVWVVVQSATDFTKRAVNGSRANETPILPGYENNILAPNGLPDRTAASERAQGTLNAGMFMPDALLQARPGQAAAAVPDGRKALER